MPSEAAIDPGPAPERGEFGEFATLVVSGAVAVTATSFNVWWPFLPLYAIELGARSDANALFWVAVATTAQGLTRLASGPVWGVLSDRFGRKMMLLRALYLSVITGVIATFVQAPWQLAVALGTAGLFSGFVPASVALISVSVPDSRLNSSLSKVAGAQYVGSMAGPALGAGLAIALGFRGAIFAASIIPLFAGTAVLFLVPADQAASSLRRRQGEPRVALEPFRLSFQFLLAVFVLFMIFGLTQLVRLATPIALRGIAGDPDVEGITGLAFSLGGLASTLSVLFLAPRLFRAGRYRPALAAASAVAAAGMVALALAWSRLAFVGGFILVTLALSAMLPATNTLIAASVNRARRGTAFGVAGSAQAISLMAGPAAAAAFAAVSLDGGFLLLSVLLLLLGLGLLAALREPALRSDDAAAATEETGAS